MALNIFCGLTASIDYNDCDKFAGGLVGLALGAYSSTVFPVWTYGAFNIITGATAAPVYYDIDQTSRVEFTNWAWTPDDTANKSASGTLVLTFFVYGVNALTIARTGGINNSLFRAIIYDKNGKYFHIGTAAREPALAKITNAGSGAAGADIPGFELTLTVKSKDIVYEMDETTALTLIN